MFPVWILIVCVIGTHVRGHPTTCEKLASLAMWKEHNTIVETTMDTLAGTWISEGCETRPGPEYVLRFYTFHEDGFYKLIQHHYWDPSCSSPKLTITSHGRITIRNSIVQPESCNGIAKPTNITVTPHDAEAARTLDSLVTTECPGQYWKSWKRNEEYVVYHNRHEHKTTFNLWLQSQQPISNHHPMNRPRMVQEVGNIRCLGYLKLAFNELKLLKIQFRPVFNNFKKHMRQVEMELLLGDIHSSKRSREFYSPTSFQVPLLRQTKGENLTILGHNFLVKSSNSFPTNLIVNLHVPPHLNEKPHLPPYIWGEWTSTSCESRPMDVYLTRTFFFNEEDMSWIGEHKFFADPFCTILKFVVVASGHFELPGASLEMRGSTNIDFEIERATLTAMDENVITDMRLNTFCGIGEWIVNEPKELSPTYGCIYLGIVIPSIRYDILKVEMDYRASWLLFLGQTDTNNLPTSSNDRPTAFQLPLVKCGDEMKYSKGFRGLFRHTSHNGAYQTNCSIFLYFILLLARVLL